MATPIGPPIDARPWFGPERRALLELLGHLGTEDWARPTVAPRWSVLDVALHLLGDDLGRLARSRDAAAGVARRPGEGIVAFVDRINDEWVVAARRLSPRLVVDLLAFTGPQVEELWAGADLGALGEPVSWAGPQAAPVWLDCARDLAEYWTHRRQIADAAGLDAGSPPGIDAVVLDTFARALPHTLADVGAPAGTVVELVVDGAGGGRWSVVRRDDGWWLTAPPPARPAALVALDADTAWRLATRAVQPEEAAARAEVAGDLRLVKAVLQLRSAIV